MQIVKASVIGLDSLDVGASRNPQNEQLQNHFKKQFRKCHNFSNRQPHHKLRIRTFRQPIFLHLKTSIWNRFLGKFWRTKKKFYITKDDEKTKKLRIVEDKENLGVERKLTIDE